MILHEYQAKTLFQSVGIPVPMGVLLPLPVAADRPLSGFPPGPWVVKAQIRAGGRGKAGGILKIHTPEALRQTLQRWAGRTLVTAQTGPTGLPIRQVWVEQAQDVQKEIYVACVMDRRCAGPLLLASAEGGIEIEHSAWAPRAVLFEEPFDPSTGLSTAQADAVCQRLGVQGIAQSGLAMAVKQLCSGFLEWDATLAEINPLAITSGGSLMALDAKIILDDNARFRHPEWDQWENPEEEDPREIRARKAGVSYVAMGGTIGCLVNGAGLAMATMDLLQHAGGRPANFLDVGGGANAAQVSEAFQILVSDPQVKVVFVNIFGGIMKCDVIAEALVEVFRQTPPRVPVVVRLEGTRVGEGKEILQRSGIPLHLAHDLAEAAALVLRVRSGPPEAPQ